MKISRRRVRAVMRTELRGYGRDRSIVIGMAVIPFVFLIQPLVSVFALRSSSAVTLRQHHELLYMLAIPALVPAALAAYAIVGERQHGTLEPLLTTPIRREELIVGKALAVLLPSIVISYAVYGLYLVVVALFAPTGIAPALIRGPDVLAQIVFTPLLATWSIWIAMAISTRVSEIRVAQQLSMLASLPSIAVTTLLAIDVIHPSTRLAVLFGILLIGLDRAGWRVVSSLLDRERLIAGPQARGRR
jgi:ABC-type transport system involved in multi-copper enzyme maturation permease subunit